MTTVIEQAPLPRVGMLAIVRKRRGVITEVREFSGTRGVIVHRVRVEYKDEFRPSHEDLIWELEPETRLLEPNELPRAGDPPMPPEDFDSLVRATRWGAVNPFLNPDESGTLDRLPFSAPFYGAIEAEDYQLIPLLKALRMPRVNLLIADDVGLGKTIEAGLIVTELLIRRRINRVLILSPASLRIQWRDEMQSKFSLPFDIVDRDSTFQLKKSLGIDSNPWRCFTRIISSYHYLRQPDVLEQFRSASQVPEDSAQLPWDLLIVDEVHNLMPSPFGDDSQLCQTLRSIVPLFEHRIFLTATPHNGHTRSFSGLLEILDPVRFSRTDELTAAQRERVRQVVIRRLKREINARTNPPRFCTRMEPKAIMLHLPASELQLVQAFEQFRSRVRSVIASGDKRRYLAGNFAIEILGKRLLSCPMTFLESWSRCKKGLEEEEIAADADLIAAGRTVEDEIPDDREAQQREQTASSMIGSWLKDLYPSLRFEIERIDRTAQSLGVHPDDYVISQNPSSDARFDVLGQFIETNLRANRQWRNDERLVIFTEYKTTLDYLLRRLRERYASQEERFLYLFGGMDDTQREQVKEAFNDPDSPVRVLVATDAASEGLNLQTTARYMLHYDCPWNPSRLEQRNGRLDRHGQARDVHIFHFASDQSADLKFISYLIKKVDQIREDLGAVSEIIDEATHRRLIEGEDLRTVQETMDSLIEKAKTTLDVNADDSIAPITSTGEAELMQRLKALGAELDLDPQAQHDTLDTALSMKNGRPQLSPPDEKDRFSLLNPSLLGWRDTIDECVRKSTVNRTLGPIPKLTFSSRPFLEFFNGRPVFRPRIDTLMLHLGHPLMQKAISAISRRRYPGGEGSVSRWSVRYGDVPASAEALILLHMEELGVNALRETFHHWIVTHQIPVVDGSLGQPLPHRPAERLRSNLPCADPALEREARDLLSDLEPDLRKFVNRLRADLTQRLQRQLAEDGEAAKVEEEKRYQSRQGEVSTLIEQSSLAKLEREIEHLKAQQWEGRLFETHPYLEDVERSMQHKEEELVRRKRHYEEVRKQLAAERERILKHLLPNRFALLGEAQVFPVAVEIRLPMPNGGAK